MLFLYLVFIAHFTKFTRGSSLFMVNLCSWKNQKRKKVLGKKTKRKEERKGTTLSGKEKNPLWKRLVLAELSRWLPDFEQRSRCQSKIWRTWCWKRGYLFFMQVPALIQKHQQLPRIVILKLYVDLLSCSSAHFAGFPFLPRVFPLPLATLLVIVTSSSTLHWAIEIKKKCLKWVTFPWKSWSVVIDARRSYRPIVLLVCGFRRRDNLLTWRELFANLYELKSGIWFWEEYNHFERI